MYTAPFCFLFCLTDLFFFSYSDIFKPKMYKESETTEVSQPHYDDFDEESGLRSLAVIPGIRNLPLLDQFWIESETSYAPQSDVQVVTYEYDLESGLKSLTTVNDSKNLPRLDEVSVLYASYMAEQDSPLSDSVF